MNRLFNDVIHYTTMRDQKEQRNNQMSNVAITQLVKEKIVS